MKLNPLTTETPSHVLYSSICSQLVAVMDARTGRGLRPRGGEFIHVQWREARQSLSPNILCYKNGKPKSTWTRKPGPPADLGLR